MAGNGDKLLFHMLKNKILFEIRFNDTSSQRTKFDLPDIKPACNLMGMSVPLNNSK